jgi:ABC-type multidrug transport system fused ATPase/permease subunit
MNEVLLAIKMVKFYAWERRFADEVARLRAKELSILRKAAGIKTFNLVVVFVVPPLMALAIYGMYIREQPLTPAVAFVVISLFNTLRFPLVVLPRALRGTAESVTAIKTIQEFLLKPEYTPLQKKKKPGVKFTKATFGYDQNPVVHDLTLELPKGKLLGIAGPVGSGKTSIISAILGEATLISGSFEVGGRMAYVPQTPWVQCATVRDNVRPPQASDAFYSSLSIISTSFSTLQY